MLLVLLLNLSVTVNGGEIYMRRVVTLFMEVDLGGLEKIHMVQQVVLLALFIN